MKPKYPQIKRVAMFCSAISIGGLTAWSPTGAQEGAQLEEVLVTASKRGIAISAQDSNYSVTAFGQDTIEKMGVEGFTDFSRAVPGLDVVDRGPSQKAYIIRGLNGDGESTVGVYVDNIPMVGSGSDALGVNGNQPDLGSFDMSAIEVLRGPQGTLYGASSVSGVVRYVTNKPNTEEFEGRIQLDAGTIAHGSSVGSMKGMVNIPLAENKAALRLVGYYRDFGGFVDNVVLGRDPSCYARGLANLGAPGRTVPEVGFDYSNPTCTSGVAEGQEDINSYTVKGIRAQLGWDISENSTLNFQYFHQETDIDGRTASNPFDSSYRIGPPFIPGGSTFFTPAAGDLATNVRGAEPHTDEMNVFGVEYDHQFENLSLSVSLNRLERDLHDYLDSSSPARLHNRFFNTPLGPWGGATISRFDRVAVSSKQSVEQTTLEARIASSFDGPFNFLVGVFSQDLQTDLDSKVPELSPVTGLPLADTILILDRQAGVDQTSNALFGEAYWDINDQLQFMAGLRYFDINREQRSFLTVPFVNSVPIGGRPGNQPSEKKSFDDVTYKAQITYRPTENAQVYAQYAEGFRAGGVNAQITPNIPPSFDPDTAISTELGIKTSWMDGRLFANFSIYNVDWENTQIGASFTSQFNGLVNCSEHDNPATSKGWEAEITFQATEKLTAGMTYTAMDGHWNIDPNTCVPADVAATLSDPIGGEAGQKLIGIPDSSFSMFVDQELNWTSSIPGYVRLDVFKQAEVDVNQIRVDRNIKNPSYVLANLRLGASFENFDLALYVRNLTDEKANLSFFNNFQQENRVTPAQPRTVGLTFDYRF
jgi:outer membrane receptor protein involved in Fe transport